MTERPILDWRSRHDPRSRQYRAWALWDAVSAPTRPRFWTPGPVLDQGREGACVGFAWAGELAASPIRVRGVNEAYAHAIYRRAQQLDPWPGEAYSGTSVLAGAQTCAERGLIAEYRWAFSVEELRDAVISLGPAVIGVPWREGMYKPRPSGLIDVTGPVVGGHALLVTGYHPRMRIRGEGWFRRHEVFRLRNSWGPRYGRGGNALISAADLAALLAENGEACIPVTRHAEASP